MVVLRGMMGVATPPSCLNAQREGSDVQQQEILHVAGQDACLDGCANSDGLIRVDRPVRLFLENLDDLLLDCRHARLTADKNDLIDLAGRQPPHPPAPACTVLPCAQPARQSGTPDARA